MPFCADYERDYRERLRRQRLRRHGELSAALLAHDVEHWWRSHGEPAIREQMEQNLAAWHTKHRKERSMKRLLVAALICALSVPAFAQTPTVTYDIAAPTTVAEASQWSAVLYVNNTPFPSAHTCALVATVVTCSFPLPNITSALTPSGPQTFEVSLKDAVVGEGPKSSPLVRSRPGAPINLRFP